jgi:3-hydroxyacyl-CoA dehydrogenase/enoyl-CoA hydratase/3-hydroxybutyryl-CoA epimerase
MPIFQSENVAVEKDADGSVVLILDVAGRSHNVFTRQVLADLDAALDKVAALGGVPVLVVRSGKKTGFLAGADLNEFLAVKDAAGAEALSALGQGVFNKLAALPVPSVAAISGPCVGGGLELALACDYRLVFDKSGTQLSQPEVRLGLLPGWGGTQRLPRVVGLERSLEMILTGKSLGAREALAWGLADALATTENELRDQFAKLVGRAIAEGKRRREKLPLRTWRQKLMESTAFGRGVILQTAKKRVARRGWDDMPAPGEALEAVRVGLTNGMEAGLAQERQAAGRLALSTACHNLVRLRLAELNKQLPEELRGYVGALNHVGARSPDRAPTRVGVVGAGTMGAGIAQLAAVKGCEVVVQEVNESALGAGLLKVRDLFTKAVERKLLTAQEADRRLAMVRGTLTWEGFADVDLVVEAAVENLDAKRAVFRELEARTRPTTPLATNTSSLSVGQLQEGLAHPERVAGLHFFNPVHKMPLVEVARAPQSADPALAVLAQWALDLGKLPVLVRDSPGFVVNRVLMPYLNETVLLVAEGLKIEKIDATMRRFGMPMGPLELLDQIGLDIAAHVAESMRPVLEGRFPPNPGFERMRVNGWLGQKSGRGFYIHRGKRPKVNDLAQNLLRSQADGTGAALARALSPAARLSEARERMVLLMVNEAAMALGEGLASSADVIDLAMVFGTGWAPQRGGPLHYADERGLGEVVQALVNLAGRYGPRFEPCEELKRRANAGEAFTRPMAAAAVV